MVVLPPTPSVVFEPILTRLAKCHHTHHPGWCRLFRVWVSLETEHTVFCRKFYLLLEFIIFFVKVLENEGNITFKVFFCELIVIHKCISMILSIFFCILLLTLLCCKFGIAKNQALFGLKVFSLKLGWCKKKYILQV